MLSHHHQQRGSFGTTSCAHNKCKWKNVCLSNEATHGTHTGSRNTSESCNFFRESSAFCKSLVLFPNEIKYIYFLENCVVDLPSRFPILLIQLCLNHHKRKSLFFLLRNKVIKKVHPTNTKYYCFLKSSFQKSVALLQLPVNLKKWKRNKKGRKDRERTLNTNWCFIIISLSL